MKQAAYVLSTEKRRALVRTGIVEVCNFRQWYLHALHVRTNHVHGVVDAADPTSVVIRDWKCYASRLLRKDGQELATRIFWTHGGSARKIATGRELVRAVDYVLTGQGEAMEVYCAPKQAVAT